jgi:glutathione S-transferase
VLRSRITNRNHQTHTPPATLCSETNRLMLPVLYSFRRCPYAMRARLALYASSVAVELREVSLRDKPASMLAASPKGSVPVLVLPDGRVIDESWDIMKWALHRHDPHGWLGTDDHYIEAAIPLVSENDTSFKHSLDRYKYPDRHPAHPQSDYRQQAEVFLLNLESRLSTSSYLLGNEFSIADAALFPFIRQFAEVDKDWFAQAPYGSLQRWLKDILGSQGFAAIMGKYAIWHPGDPPVIMAHKTDNPE